MSDDTIEDVLEGSWPDTEIEVAELYAATADGPVFSADGEVVVHRTDPELWLALRSVYWRLIEAVTEDATYVPTEMDLEAIEAAAALLAAPAPADPEEAGR